ncbi:MAG: NAD(P)H-dependent oxidoreductase [Gammaproteobacteria bacterium]|nr:NAD(P)H-dependent oxidoreductase [Gammaproteobacteria bacterium]
MKFGIIVGSMQNDSGSAKVGRYCAEQLQANGHSSYTLDLGANPLPMWDNSIWKGDEDWKATLGPISDELESCEGFVVISPEYNGMVPAALKNFFLCFGNKVLGHKPAHIVAVSAGIGGSYPIAELRMRSYKNCRICFTPEHTIVRHVGSVLNTGGKNDTEQQQRTVERLDYGLDVLAEYTKGLAGVRASGVIDHERFGNGM